VNFTKMQGLGNDFVVIDETTGETETHWAVVAPILCNRHFGIGADGVLLLRQSTCANFRIDILNADGSVPEMCGNGVRCASKFFQIISAPGAKNFSIETISGILEVEIDSSGQVRIAMGKPETIYENIELGSMFSNLKGIGVRLGNPHLVVFVPSVSEIDVADWGSKLEVHPLFKEKTNVHFVERISANKLRQRTWERGSGLTLACGSGASCSAFAARQAGLVGNDVQVELDGGTLQIEIQTDLEIFMTGPAEISFNGIWPNVSLPKEIESLQFVAN